MPFKTADLYDLHLDNLQVADPMFRDFGGKTAFHGQIVTLQALDDNTYLRAAFSEQGKGKVLVVDCAGSLRCAMMGDMMADLAASNGWEGVVIHGCIRDSAAVAKADLGVKAIATSPRKSSKRDQGVRHIPLRFAGVTFCPNDYLYADEDGIVLSEVALT